MRVGEVKRKTAETDISLRVNLDASGKNEIDTGCGFLNHMLTLFAVHGKFELSVSCKGDTDVDDHHTVEDIGICLGMAFSEALGDRRGITRYGSMLLPMDEALVLTALDISGRSCLCYQLQIPAQKIGSFDTELVEEFFQGFVRHCPMSLHFRQLAGSNSHHIVEAAFKSFARALRIAIALDGSDSPEIPSTKGTLS